MTRKLLVVESPNKIKKLRSIIGHEVDIVATVGHFVDLPRQDLGVDLGSMEPSYEPTRPEVVRRLRAAAKHACELLLATDPDREGEAIAWHVLRVLGKTAPPARRVRFQQLTPDAVNEAVSNPSKLDDQLVDAQQARRVLDRLCGYQISPLLWPFGKRLSAGRVQSAALHLVVERERARRGFQVQTYWEVHAHYQNGLKAAVAERAKDSGKLVVQRFFDASAAETVADQLRTACHLVQGVTERETLVHPRPPFTTSTLQQLASSRLKLAPEATMKVAQQLFEAGLITYHRSDSVHLSDEAIRMARDEIAAQAPEALPPQPPRYRSKAGSQEAHEAIRPTRLDVDETEFAELDDQAQALWELVRDRFLASQCLPARLLQSEIVIDAGGVTLLARLSRVLEPGFKRFLDHDETKDASTDGLDCEVNVPIKDGQPLDLTTADAAKKNTKPPSRFTEATLVREMERVGIGRPSTYAATVALLKRREYVGLDKRHVVPLELGELVDELLAKGFSDLLEPQLTAEWEERLDAVAQGALAWRHLCSSYQSGLVAQLERARPLFEELAKSRGIQPTQPAKPTGKACPLCSAELVLKQGKKGAFLGCSGYPECKYTADPNAQPVDGVACPECEAPMTKRKGRNGPFLSCTRYPECRGTRDLNAQMADGVACPQCEAPMTKRKGRNGPFLSCTRYPKCRGTRDVSAGKGTGVV